MGDLTRLHDMLRHVDFFSFLDDRSLSLLEAKMDYLELMAGECLCAEGDPGDCMYVVDYGEIRVVKQGAAGVVVEVAVIGPGEVAGIMSLFEDAPRSASLIGASPSGVWGIDQGMFNELLMTQPRFARGMLNVLSGHLRRETRLVAELQTQEADKRTKVAIFDNKPYVQEAFDAGNDDRFALKYFNVRLDVETAMMAAGCPIVCVFVNDCVDASVVERLSHLGVGMVALRCAGYNNVDLAACEAHGISVTRVPAYSPYAVAEHAVALMMGLNRHIHRANNRIREGNFSLDGLVGFDMHGKTVGVIGTGKIGCCLVNILLGFGCEVKAFDKYPRNDLAALDGVTYTDLDDLFASADIISLHAPLTPETRHLVNAEAIEKMKSGVMLINTSRGSLVDTQALIQGLLSGKVGAAGLDVYEEESSYFFEDFSDGVIEDETLARLMTFNNVLVTSHMAFLTREALSNISDSTFGSMRDYVDGKRGDELVNIVKSS